MPGGGGEGKEIPSGRQWVILPMYYCGRGREGAGSLHVSPYNYNASAIPLPFPYLEEPAIIILLLPHLFMLYTFFPSYYSIFCCAFPTCPLCPYGYVCATVCGEGLLCHCLPTCCLQTTHAYYGSSWDQEGRSLGNSSTMCCVMWSAMGGRRGNGGRNYGNCITLLYLPLPCVCV